MAGVLRREDFCSEPTFSFQELEAEGRAIVERAREQARQIVAGAEQQGRERGAQLAAEARRRGLEEGRRAGHEQALREARQSALQEAREDLGRLSRALSEGLTAFEENKRRLLATAECGLIELALAVARRVCKHDVGGSSAAALANARALLEMVKHEADVELHLNPAECDALRSAAAELGAASGRLTHVEIVPDAAVARGGCVLHARDGTIDALLETQLDRVADALVEKHGHEG